MNTKLKKILSALLSLLVIVSGTFSIGVHDHTDLHDHAHEGEEDSVFSLLELCEDIIGGMLSMLSTPVYADYEDGVECEYCGGWRYDDWKCDNGDHCGDGADGDCYNEHHCGSCGDCVDEGDKCDDCEFCFECCECEDKCRGCYEMGETVCKECCYGFIR